MRSAFALVACCLIACATGRAAGAGESSFSQAATKRCLAQRHIPSTAVPRADAQRKAFHDLAQRTSLEARVGSTRVDLAFTPSADHAQLLIELLSPARPPYVVGKRANVVVMQRKDASAIAVATILRCLR